MLDQIAKSLKAHFDPALVDELLAAYQDAKHNFFLVLCSARSGGRFCEAALRMLQQQTTGTFMPGKTLDANRIISQLSNTPGGSFPDLVRLHIPRAIRVVYDVRKQHAAHLADGDPNWQDASLVIGNIDWVQPVWPMHHGVTADEAQRIIKPYTGLSGCQLSKSSMAF